MDILRNAVECTECGDVIESTYRHDFVGCSCGSIFTDGGRDYIRRGGNVAHMIDRSEYAPKGGDDLADLQEVRSNASECGNETVYEGGLPLQGEVDVQAEDFRFNLGYHWLKGKIEHHSWETFHMRADPQLVYSGIKDLLREVEYYRANLGSPEGNGSTRKVRSKS